MQPSPSSSLAAEASAPSNRLPIAALAGLAAAGFLCIVTETLPAGLLPSIAAGLQISEAMAGQLVALYALGSLLAAIPLTSWTQGLRRRPVLLGTVICFVIGNTLTAMAESLSVVLVARFIAGCAAGLAWGILAGYARSIVRPEQTGAAMAVAMVGVPLALSLGVPMGTFLGSLVGWRGSFLILSALALMLIGWIVVKVPDAPGRNGESRLSLLRVLRTKGIVPILLVILAWMTAHNILYTYIAPFSTTSQSRVDLVLLAFGISSLVGIWLVGRFVDRLLRLMVLIAIGSFALTAIVLSIAADQSVAVYLGAVVWGLGFGGAGAMMQTASADAAGDGVDLAQAMVTTAWNLAIAGGGAIGGALLTQGGTSMLPPTVAILASLAFVIALAARRYAFPPGGRAQGHR
ncbi:MULTISPECIES: MFS transporter [unclassified Pseudomonas]|uniref:MFS transporter n=1 Tax=unclassified Pseudomonas TaxID=196821 RepID=UPI000BD2574B|nr:MULTISPECIES: MFS transporter [unclassified Pseudomonas]PVZ19885.1 putative MFS family arabinose efflux permease [Pseudomonas sp. URIL14HWK12:I12]PVZ26951.1 putative MFS family arabinose efflux permease [Pseudomonas sp. URIL14HWK12:I10]PVZ37840.1 putative MFS family arabinose efflux permease [Pseudomonas sp. URIL14HWK12:I11]SNZ05457.1 Predicted arabinose efflux permease, MFS family [Pseudomonas sp. URIL14HWK12:I9]